MAVPAFGRCEMLTRQFFHGTDRNDLLGAAATTHPHGVQLWLAFLDEIDDARLLADYRRFLTATEREQEQRFHFARDRRRYLVTRALARTVLSRYAAMPPERLCFGSNDYGKPELVACNAEIGRLSFNISHASNLIVLAVTRDCAVGVDIESLSAKPVSTDLADRYFARHEADALRALPSALQHQRFFEYWTLKEAYIKARGMGLSIALDRFGFRFDGAEQVSMWAHPDLNDCPSRWHFHQLRVAAEYLVAVCTEQPRTVPAPQITAARIVPLISEEPMPYTPLRMSNGRAVSAAW